mgnify:CR=1 FL=1
MKQTKKNNKNTWANNYIVRRVSRIRIEKKDEEKSDTFVHALMETNLPFGCYQRKSTVFAFDAKHV